MKKIFRCLFVFALVLPCTLFARRDEGLLIYMDFDNQEDAGTNPRNISGTDRMPQIVGTLTRSRVVPGKFVRSAEFSNANGNKPFPDNYAIGLGDLNNYYKGSFSVAFWFKSNKNGAREAMITGNRDWANKNSAGWAITMVNKRNFSLRIGGQDIDAAFPQLTNGNWHHVALIVDRKTNTASFYGDGKKVGSAKIPAGMLGVEDSETLIGGSGRGAFSAPNAKKESVLVDDYAIWTRPLTEKEVVAMWDEGQGARVPEPSAFSLLCGIAGLAVVAFGVARRRRCSRHSPRQ